ncbi:SDR family oxidoreductase [bacterium]|nr:SDR family oxidoreductase [bacterium]
MLLKDKVAIITGASRGIGAATALHYAKEGGCIVVNFAHNQDAADAIVEQIKLDGGRAIAVCADVSDVNAVNAVVEQTKNKFGGRIDILVNNAFPGFIGGTVGDANWKDFEESWEVIVHGTFNCCQAVLPTMMSQRYGRIINIGTTSMWELNEAHAPYITAKGALVTMTRALARDYGKFNITANMVTPGLVWTNLTEPQQSPHPSPHAARTPLGRIANADDIAKACVFFASELADFITGVNLPVCGGMLMQ